MEESICKHLGVALLSNSKYIWCFYTVIWLVHGLSQSSAVVLIPFPFFMSRNKIFINKICTWIFTSYIKTPTLVSDIWVHLFIIVVRPSKHEPFVFQLITPGRLLFWVPWKIGSTMIWYPSSLISLAHVYHVSMILLLVLQLSECCPLVPHVK